LSKQLNVMQTTYLQQPDQLLNLNERHTKHNTSVSWESQTLNEGKDLVECVISLQRGLSNWLQWLWSQLRGSN